MERVLATEGEGEARFVGLLNALRDVYEENRIYLKPLVIDYHSSMFSRAYRQMLKDALKKDGNFSCLSGRLQGIYHPGQYHERIY